MSETINNFEHADTFGAEKDHNPFEDFPRADAVLVLGGELRKRIIRSKNEKSGEITEREKIEPGIESKMRALGALELFANGVVKKIVFTGGKMKFPAEGVDEMPDIAIGEAMKKYLEPQLKKYNVPLETILVDDKSINTTENVQNGLALLKKENIRSFYLESSGYHEERGLALLKTALKKAIGVELKGSFSAEELLRERSSHYEELLSHFEFPKSLAKAPKEAIIKGVREFLRRILIYRDPEDKTATFLANRLRK